MDTTMNESWWLIVLFLFVFMGNGWGGNSTGANDNYVLASDFATLQRQVDSSTSSLERKGDTINAGLCDGFYAMNTGLLNGFNSVNSAITQAQINGMQNANALQSSINTGFCQTNYNGQSNTRDIIDSQNGNTQAILAAINAMNISYKDEKIAELTQQVNALNLAASQSAQNAYLISQLKTTTTTTT